MGAPAVAPVSKQEVERIAADAVTRALGEAGLNSDSINHIPSNDELSRTLEALERHKDDVVRAARETIDGTFDEKFRAALPEDLQARVDHIEAKLKEADKRGNPLSARDPRTTDDERKERIYDHIGKHITARVYMRKGQRLPDSLRNDLGGLTRTATAGDDTKGAIIISDLRTEDWMRVKPDHSLARRVVRSIPLDDSLTMIVPTLLTDPELEDLPEEDPTGAHESTPTWENEANSSVTARTLAGKIRLSRQLPPKQMERLQAFYGQLLVEQAGKKEDRWFFNLPTGPFVDMLRAAGNTHLVEDRTSSGGANGQAFKDSQFEDWDEFQDTLADNIEGIYVMHPSMFGHIRRLRDDNNRPLWASAIGHVPGGSVNVPVSEFAPRQLNDRPCWLTTVMPKLSDTGADKAMALYFDPSKALIGDGPDTSIEVDDSVRHDQYERTIYLFRTVAMKLFVSGAASVMKTRP